ncbi:MULTISPECIES: hypothetical protein [Lactobacillus]|nr:MULTISPECIES: hypothetical protein [Lactobacillus]AIS09929.1 hypothetical protein LACWKB8_1675 [Lactobacillus sp. wkB8]KGG53423.1 hypothetical protein LACWKB10_1783 [Lactobacillus sp. wkB10]MBC6343149.1 hypothetical protein [Lactobacillus kimbladii]NUE98956.1 hypothetical protein [Lactobacillus melliventris]RMC55392.1 hypothetical protein F5ESL0260_09395 [Lactobacillus sp. ESL0260]
MIYDFSMYLSDLDDQRLFQVLKKSNQLDLIWKEISLIRQIEINEKKENIQDLVTIASKAMKFTNLKNQESLSKKWANYILFQETDAIFVYLFSQTKCFLKNNLIIINEEKLNDIKRGNTIIFSPHWGDFYSIPIILASLRIQNVPLANGDEGEHMRSILDVMLSSLKKYITEVLDTSNPVNALFKLDNLLKNSKNILEFPEYTLGPKPKYRTKYLDNFFPVAYGLAALAKRNNSNIQPVTFTRIDDFPHYELRFYSKINIKDMTVGQINNNIHRLINSIIVKTPEKWWYWYLFSKNRISIN